MIDLFETVQALIDLRYSVVPSKGKHPLVKWKPYQEKLPTQATYDSWRYKMKPSLWGIVTGKLSGVVVVDCDSATAMLVMGDLKPHVRTPRGGGHYYFDYPGHFVKTVAGLLQKMDIRADGGFVNTIGTTSKGEYRIEIMPTPQTIYRWDQMPKVILDAMDRPKAKPETEPGESILEGQRNDRLTRKGGSMARSGFSPSAIEAALLKENAERCQPPLPEDEVRAIAKSVARYEPAAASLGEAPEIVSAKELIKMNLSPLKSVLPGMIVAGLTIMTAKPKAGKGWWVLQAAYSVALGKNLFDGSECERGRVLYMGLEDSLLRLQYRVNEINNSTMFAKVIGKSKGGGLRIATNLGKIPDGLDLTIRWPKIDEGCIEYLEKYLDEHPDTRLIIIDIFKRVAKAKKGKGSTYEEDYESIQPVQEFATRRKVAVIVVHHNRKAGAEDPIDMVSGTFGITGAVDSVIVIQKVTRGETYDESKFSFIGRDIDEQELAMKFDKRSHVWSLIGDADTHFMGEKQKVILELLEHEVLGPKEIAERLDMKEQTAKSTLWRMAKIGLLVNDSGKYRTASR